MTAVNDEDMSLSPEQLNDLDRWLLDFLHAHEWATPNLMRQLHNDEQDDENDHVSRQWVSRRLSRLREHDCVAYVHDGADEYQLVSDPRDD